MNRSTRYHINAILCLLVAAHAVYWFVNGNADTATQLRTALAVAQAVLGVIGAVWFWSRARGFTA
jgi:hypothetical protein